MTTVATVCDGIVECVGAEDETWICKNNKIPLYGVFVCCGLMLTLVLVSKCYRENQQKKETTENSLLFPTHLDEETFKKNHDDPRFKKKINVVLKRSQLLDNKETRIQKNRNYYKLELTANGGDVSKTICCMKNYLDPAIFKTVVEDIKPGLVRRCFPWIETFLEKLDEKKWIRWLFRKVKQIATIYVDLSKDSLLVFSIILAVGGIPSLLVFPTKLTW